MQPITAPPSPRHIAAQQLMALCLQERSVGRRDWSGWLRGVPAFAAMPEGRLLWTPSDPEATELARFARGEQELATFA
jgi:hypothetical protein